MKINTLRRDNYSKEFLCELIKKAYNDVRQLRYDVRRCQTVCEREKAKLQNRPIEEHIELWRWRERLFEDKELLKIKKKRHRELNNLLNKLYNQPSTTQNNG